MLNMIKNSINNGASPQDILMKALENNNNPMINNLVGMAKSGNIQNVESFARNLFKENGRDFDKEFAEFMNKIR